SQLEGQMDLSLPDTAQAANPLDTQATVPSSQEVELPSDISVIVKAQPEGEIGQLSVHERQGKREIADLALLTTYLEEARVALGGASDIRIQADSALRYAHVMEVMDACTKAGFRNVALAPPPDLLTEGKK